MSSPSSAARKRQIITGVISGVAVGVIISALTQFWWWLPTGIVVGVAAGMLMKPPQSQ